MTKQLTKQAVEALADELDVAATKIMEIMSHGAYLEGIGMLISTLISLGVLVAITFIGWRIGDSGDKKREMALYWTLGLAAAFFCLHLSLVIWNMGVVPILAPKYAALLKLVGPF